MVSRRAPSPPKLKVLSRLTSPATGFCCFLFPNFSVEYRPTYEATPQQFAHPLRTSISPGLHDFGPAGCESSPVLRDIVPVPDPDDSQLWTAFNSRCHSRSELN